MKRNIFISKQLESYIPLDDIEFEMKNRLIDFVLTNNNCMDPSFTYGHITGSAWIINNSAKYALLTYHKRLNKWLQLGGHCENEFFVKDVSYREAVEESGLKSIKLINEDIFSIDIHKIPMNTSFPEHFHFDLRFLFTADMSENIIVSSESKDVKWIELSKIKSYNVDVALQRMVDKTIKIYQ
jgi:hypothetical protein